MAQAPLVATDPTEFAQLAAAAVAREIRLAVEARGACALMLAGGNTPRAIYEELGRERDTYDLPWEKITLFFGDERCVTPENPASNYGMVKRALLDALPVPPAAVHRMRGEDPDPEHAAVAYEALLPERIDVLLLGLGEDGHTASIFPGSPALAEKERRVIAVQAPKPPALRITITPPVIRTARRVIVLASGSGKAPVVARVLGATEVPVDFPAGLARKGLWILDREAAQSLPSALHADAETS